MKTFGVRTLTAGVLVLTALAIPSTSVAKGDSGRAAFRFPFFTIASVTILDDRALGVLNDNDEFITIRLEHRLHAEPRVLPQPSTPEVQPREG